MLRRMSRLGLGVALALATFGCAQEREPISRVQPNALKKTFFVGEDLQSTADDPEFHYRGTVVDTGYGAAQDGLFTSTYAMPVSRIKWEITETKLVARLAYERIENTDGKVGTTKGQQGQVVAAFPIQSHFDIRRSYNPVTGEEQNVVEENISDRPWYEREFIRVDWSRNEVNNAYDFDTLSMIGVYGGVQYEPMSYYVNDPTDPDAPVFDEGYFDVTQKVYATPQMLTFAPDLASIFGVSSFPACMLDADIGGGSAPTGNCNPHELKLRLSFKKVVDTDYEAQDWDGVRFQAFGAFTLNFNGRMGYTRPYGIVDQKTHRFIERYNIWDRSHYYDDAANMTGAIACGSGDDYYAGWDEKAAKAEADAFCNGAVSEKTNGMGGSRCDVYAKKCTLPFRLRKERPIVWYYNDGDYDKTNDPNAPWAEGMFEPTDWATIEWDVAMRSARTAARLVECKAQGGEDCDSQFPHWKGQMEDQEDAVRLAREANACRRKVYAYNAANPNAPQSPDQCLQYVEDKAAELGIEDRGVIEIVKQPPAVILCHSPVAADDAPECSANFSAGAEKRTRLGDLRYNQVVLINTPQTPSSWGIMVDAKDPLTGENIAASINIWNHVTDSAAQGTVDTIRYINGELSTAEITDGKYIKDWVSANEGLAGGSKSMPVLSKDDVIDRLVGSTDGKNVEATRELVAKSLDGTQALPPAVEAQLKKISRDIRATNDLTKSSNGARIQARMAQARGTDFEAQLINTAALEAAGDMTKAGAGAESLSTEFASPLRRGNSQVTSRIRQMREMALAERGACIVEAAPEFSSIIGLAKIMNEKFPIERDEETGEETPALRNGRISRMRHAIARRLMHGVIIHEMGHSFGERHNFVSSYDALHFRPQYWQLRTRNGAVSNVCSGAKLTEEEAANCVGPRYFDPLTREEEDGLQWMWQQSSVMDYPGDITVDMLGLGAYDFAAARMFYGETNSVYANDASVKGSLVNIGWVTDSDGDGVVDARERLFGSDPNNKADGGVAVDSDGDKVPDTIEVSYGTDPNSAASKPSISQVNKYNADVDLQAESFTDITDRMDQFGGILGLRTGRGHYSEHQRKYNVLRADTCVEFDPQSRRPSDWNDEADGAFHNTLDGLAVSVGGSYKRCRQQPVDYVNWSELAPVPVEADAQTVTGDQPPAIDGQGRVRVPYPFASDNWADTGNVSVFRHDQGADPYEQFMYLMGSQENRHIFDHYRRNRVTFAIRPAMNRDWSRYTEKIMNSVKGLGLYRNIYNEGLSQYWPQVASSWFISPNVLAASVAMDHFSRQITRPQDGHHFSFSKNDVWQDSDDTTPLFMSAEDGFIIGPDTARPYKSPTRVTIPNGTAGYQRTDDDGNALPTGFREVSFGGRPIHNSLDRTKGDYSSSYQLSVGSYYDKINAVMALTESRDNFISASRTDFVDARYRATSVADVFPNGFRRLVAAALADDKVALGPRVAGTIDSYPDYYGNAANFCSGTDNNIACVPGETGAAFPKQPMAWKSWWPDKEPQTCWTINGSQVCATYGGLGGVADPKSVKVPQNSVAIDPEVGWEVQKYIIAWTYLYLPENQTTSWFDMMRIYRSYDLPDVQGPVVKWRDPFTGTLYVAKSFGRENIEGRSVEKGIAARVLEHAIELTQKAFETTTDPETGEVNVVLDASGQPKPRAYTVRPAVLEAQGLFDNNPYVQELKKYKSIPDFMWQAGESYGLTTGGVRGVY